MSVVMEVVRTFLECVGTLVVIIVCVAYSLVCLISAVWLSWELRYLCEKISRAAKTRTAIWRMAKRIATIAFMICAICSSILPVSLTLIIIESLLGSIVLATVLFEALARRAWWADYSQDRPLLELHAFYNDNPYNPQTSLQFGPVDYVDDNPERFPFVGRALAFSDGKMAMRDYIGIVGMVIVVVIVLRDVLCLFA